MQSTHTKHIIHVMVTKNNIFNVAFFCIHSHQVYKPARLCPRLYTVNHIVTQYTSILVLKAFKLFNLCLQNTEIFFKKSRDTTTSIWEVSASSEGRDLCIFHLMLFNNVCNSSDFFLFFPCGINKIQWVTSADTHLYCILQISLNWEFYTSWGKEQDYEQAPLWQWGGSVETPASHSIRKVSELIPQCSERKNILKTNCKPALIM